MHRTPTQSAMAKKRPDALSAHEAIPPEKPAILHLGTMASAMEIQELQDDELMTQARQWRLRALRGEKEARGVAHELEREVRRRFGNPKTKAQDSLKEVRALSELP